MFPEYRDLIAKLKQEDPHFAKVFEEHNELDHKIIRLESKAGTANIDEVDVLKKQKLALKDEIYEMLRKADEEGK